MVDIIRAPYGVAWTYVQYVQALVQYYERIGWTRGLATVGSSLHESVAATPYGLLATTTYATGP